MFYSMYITVLHSNASLNFTKDDSSNICSCMHQHITIAVQNTNNINKLSTIQTAVVIIQETLCKFLTP